MIDRRPVAAMYILSSKVTIVVCISDWDHVVACCCWLLLLRNLTRLGSMRKRAKEQGDRSKCLSPLIDAWISSLSRTNLFQCGAEQRGKGVLLRKRSGHARSRAWFPFTRERKRGVLNRVDCVGILSRLKAMGGWVTKSTENRELPETLWTPLVALRSPLFFWFFQS